MQPKPPLACQLPVNSNSFFPAQRALLVALRDWVVSGKEPPASAYPTIARKSLVPLAQIKLPYVPASEFSPAGVAAQRFHLDRGPEFRETDITGVMAEPPRIGAPYPLLLPQVDADGNHDRWAAQYRGPGAARHLYRMERPQGGLQRGQFLRSDSARSFHSSAPRRSASPPATRGLRSRSAIRPTNAYVEKVRAAAAKLVADRFLLSQDADLIVSQAEAAAIP